MVDVLQIDILKQMIYLLGLFIMYSSKLSVIFSTKAKWYSTAYITPYKANNIIANSLFDENRNKAAHTLMSFRIIYNVL